MALRKTITDQYGITTSYHRVGYISYSPSRHRPCKLTFEVLSFVSDDFSTPTRPLNRCKYTVDVSVEEEESMGLRALCYTKLKEIEEWADAEDC
jgi:hypothetical protein